MIFTIVNLFQYITFCLELLSFYINSEQEVFWGDPREKKRRRRESVSRRLVLIRFLLIGPFRHGFRESVAADGRERFFAEVVLDFAGVLLGHGGIHPEAD